MLNLIHPDDREAVLKETEKVNHGLMDRIPPYRLLHSDGSYRYVIEQFRFTDRFGEPCLQSMVIDISEIMSLLPKLSPGTE